MSSGPLTHGDIPETRFADARGARIAYQAFGSGPPMVGVPPLAQHIDGGWEWPALRAMLERFASFSRFVHFDKRGTGASDRSCAVPGLDERVDDLRAVYDAAGIESAYLLAQSGGGPTAITFAATYPDRVDGLILFGTAASMVSPDITAERRAQMPAHIAQFSERWGTDESPIVDTFAPSLAGDDQFRRWHRRYERMAGSADSIAELLRINFECDATELLDEIDTPTLVIHATGDRVIPVDAGRDLAASIDGAELIEIDSDDHFAYAVDLDRWVPNVERLVTGTVRHHPIRGTIAGSKRPSIVALGNFSVTVDGHAVPTAEWRGRLARQLCKRLAVARGEPVTRDELFELLWPDVPDRSKLGARLSVQLSHLRRVLGGGVRADRDVVALDLDEVDVDYVDFMNADDPAEIVERYAGELLPTDRYDDWVSLDREQSRQRFVAAARRLIDESPDESLSLAHRLVAVDPFDPAHHEQLIELLERSGDRFGADEARARYDRTFD